MNKKILFVMLLMIGIAFVSCDDTTTDPVNENGTITIESDPVGAQIWLDGVNTGEVTPGTVEASAGSHIITLAKDGYADLDVTVAVSAGEDFLLTTGTTLLQLGSLIIESDPAGATVWIDGENTGEVTPHTFPIGADNYTVTLQYSNYSDTTFVTQVTGGETRNESINLKPTFISLLSTTIWETIGTDATQPSGVDLSTGTASSIGTSVNADVDVFYSSENNFIVMSANGRNDMTRETYFKIGDSADLNDGVNSPTKDDTWTTSVRDDETNYIFLYDADGHYSKFQIVNINGGTPGNPAHLDIKWYYNANQDNVEF